KRMVDFKQKLLSHVVEILCAAVINEQLEQSCDAAWLGMRQHLPGLFRRRLARLWRRKLKSRLGHDLVDVIDVEKKRRRLAVPGLRQGNAEIRANCRRVAPEDDDAVGQQHRFLDV